MRLWRCCSARHSCQRTRAARSIRFVLSIFSRSASQATPPPALPVPVSSLAPCLHQRRQKEMRSVSLSLTEAAIERLGCLHLEKSLDFPSALCTVYGVVCRFLRRTTLRLCARDHVSRAVFLSSARHTSLFSHVCLPAFSPLLRSSLSLVAMPRPSGLRLPPPLADRAYFDVAPTTNSSVDL